METFNERIPKILMQNLLYPAFLGTVLVSFVYKLYVKPIPETFSEYLIYGFAVLMFLYFGSSYLMNEKKSDNYKWRNFFYDVIEVILIILAFNFLGFSNISSVEINFRLFYIVLGSVPILNTLWNIEKGRKNTNKLILINSSRVAISILGAILNNKYPLFDLTLLILLFLLMGWYIIFKILKKNSTVANSVNSQWRAK